MASEWDDLRALADWIPGPLYRLLLGILHRLDEVDKTEINRRLVRLEQSVTATASRAGPPTTAERGSSESSAQANSHGRVSGPCPSCGVSLVISPMPKGMRISMGDDLHSSVGSKSSTAQPILG